MPEAKILLILSTSFLVGLSGVLTPGPLLTMDISEAAKRGFWAGPSLVLGHGIAELAVVLALGKGLSELLAQSTVAAAINIAGGLFLLYMGVTLIRGLGSSSLSLNGQYAITRAPFSLVAVGILVSISYPFWIIWWATVGASYVAWSLTEGSIGLAAFYFGHILADLSWYSLVSFVIATGRRIIGDRVYRGMLLACGLFILGLSLYFLGSGIQLLVQR